MRFGVLIPELGTTDIFEPICQGILSTPSARSHSLAWGNTSDLARSPQDGAESLCRQYISQKVNGVFFAPVEYAEDRDRTNRRIADMFSRANIPVVLLDRCLEHYPDRCEFDLVGIDNQRAGFILTRHLLKAGAKRIIFAGRPNAAPTVDARAAGFREALYALRDDSHGKVVLADFEDTKAVKHMLDRERPDGIVCANDVTAAKLMGTIIALGKRVPEDIRMVGLDDVSYAKYLPTPLTTMRQDCAEIGAVAMSVMLERIKRPNHPVMDVRVKTELVVRASCGTTA
jgi:DNA-binding LacI/PurR family transcriptional regulator